MDDKQSVLTRCGMWGRLVAVLCALALVAAACGDDDDDGTAAPPPGNGTAAGSGEECTEDSPRGDLSVASFVAPSGLDPMTAASSGRTGAMELAAIYDVLMKFNPDSGEFQPHLAESLDSDDAQTWTLTLREGIQFGNGDPLTADAVKASLERHQNDDARLQSQAALITDIRVEDEQTVVLELAEPWGGFPVVLSGPVGMIVNPAVVEERGDEGLQSDPTGAGVGAYDLVRYAADEELVLSGKDKYWGGPVCVEALRFVAVEDASTAYDAFTNDEFDVVFLQDPLVASDAREAGVESFGFVNGAGRTVVMNAGVRGSTSPTTDQRLRQAVSHALDPELIDQRATQGNGLPTSGIFHPDMAHYPGADGPEHDPEQARELVAEVRDEGEWDGSVSLLCPELSEEAGIAITALLEDVGFEVDYEVVDTSTLVERVIRNADFDLACWQFNIPDAAPWLSLEAFRSDSSSNRGGFQSDAMDAAIEQLRVAETVEEATDAIAEIQEVWNEGVPAANWAASEDVVLWRDGVHGIGFSAESLVLFDQAFIE